MVGGFADLETLTVRAICEQGFVNDPLRILRAFRFAAGLHGTIEHATKQWIRNHAIRLPSVAAERINTELFKILSFVDGSRHVADMAELSVLEAVFPELVATRQVTENTFHHLPLFEHSIETVFELEKSCAMCRIG